MRSDQVKSRISVLQCFRPKPEFGEFLEWALNQRERDALLRWLDESGLALYLQRQLSDHGVLENFEPGWRLALQQRVDANRRRTSIMLEEFDRINGALQAKSIPYVVIKGFTLAKEFCPEPWLRHQADLDVLVEPNSLQLAKEAFVSLGYEVESESELGVGLGIRSEHAPSKDDCLYGAPLYWDAEIHSSFYEDNCGVSLSIGEDWRDHIVMREIGVTECPCLDLPHRFVGQVLHAFRHTGSWMRIAWLYEISYFAHLFRNDLTVWEQIDLLTGTDRKTQNACGVVACLAINAFGAEFPEIVHKNWIEPLPVRQRKWIEQYSLRWMLNDFGRSDKTGLILQREFADSSLTWWGYRVTRATKLLRMLALREIQPNFLVERIRRQIAYLFHSMAWNIKGMFHQSEAREARRRY